MSPVLVQDNAFFEERLSYAGWFFYSNAAGPSKGWGASTNLKGAQATFTFRGSNVAWKTTKHPVAGITDVYLDGKKVKTFDGYAPSNEFDVTGYQKTGLRDTVHTLKLVNTGTKNADSAGTFTDMDRFVVNGQSFEHNSTKIAYGPWRGVDNAKASGGTYRVSKSRTQPLIFGYVYGPHFDLITAKGPNFGQALVEVYHRYVPGWQDGKFVKRALLNLRSRRASWQVVSRVGGLDPTKAEQYMVTIASYDGRPVVFDAIEFEY